MSDIVANMIRIADAARRPDGSDIPLGEQCREAADEITRLRARVEKLEEAFSLAQSIGRDTEQQAIAGVVHRIREIVGIDSFTPFAFFPSEIEAALVAKKKDGLEAAAKIALSFAAPDGVPRIDYDQACSDIAEAICEEAES